MSRFFHPDIKDVELTDVLYALGDPIRMQIVKVLYGDADGRSCSDATPECSVAKSTLSGHFRILRESGLITTTKVGVEHINCLRKDEINKKFPMLLKTVLEP